VVFKSVDISVEFVWILSNFIFFGPLEFVFLLGKMMQKHSISFSTDKDVFVPEKYKPHDRIISRLAAYPAFCPDLSHEATTENIERRTFHAKVIADDPTIFRK
jgi:hypothetical protein